MGLLATDWGDRIASIQETTNNAYLTRVEFGWENEASTWSHPFQTWTSASAFPGVQTDYQPYFADLNGDGRKYWIQISQAADDAWFGLANADASFTAARWTKFTQSIGSLNAYAHFFADVDGDGKADWIRVARATNEAWIALGTGNGGFQFWQKSTTAVGAANNYNHFFVDVDGDSRADWVQLSKTTDTVNVGLSTGAGNFQFWTKTIAMPASGANWDSTFADVTGDGRADWLIVNKAGFWGRARVSVGDGSFVDGGDFGIQGTDTKFTFADINGDGLTDVIGVKPIGWGKTAFVALSKGDGNFAAAVESASSYGNDKYVDFSGQGMKSRFSWDPGSSGINPILTRSNGGDGYGGPLISFSATSPFTPQTPTDRFSYDFADLNGDGKEDMIVTETTSKRTWIGAGQGMTEGKITSVFNTGNPPTTITYKPFNDSTVFTPDTDAVYPLRNSMFPLRGKQRIPKLVSAVTAPNGIGGTLTTNYRYGGLRKDVAKLEFHGLRFMEATHVETGITNKTKFLQNWPFTGLVSLSKRIITSGGSTSVLSQTNHTYGCNDFVTVGSCTVAVGRRYFPFVSQSVTSAWDLNGAVFPTVTTNSQYDNFGNPTQVSRTKSDGYGDTTVSTYLNDTTKWWIGLPTRVSVTHTAP